MSNAIIWDIETGPLPESHLRTLIDPFPDFEPFDPNMVKTGNIKAADLIAAKIDEARLNHMADYECKKLKHESAFFEKAALSPVTGRVLAIGYKRESEVEIDAVDIDCDGLQPDEFDDESDLLCMFWQRFREVQKRFGHLVGHGISNFDLPFIIRRSWMLGVPVPPDVQVNNRYWHPVFIDTSERWGLGKHGEYISLDKLCKAFGLPGKNGNGADFARLFAEDRPKALAYLRNDLEITAAVAERLGVG